MRNFFSAIFRFFLTGVAALLPFVVTVFVVGWIVRVADSYIGPSSSLGVFIANLVGEHQKYAGYAVGYLVVTLLILMLGFLVTRATVARFHKAVDAMFERIPLIGKIYKAVGQLVELLGSKDQAGMERFGGVVEINLGNIRVLAFLASSERYLLDNGKEHVLVFVPNSPMPATGFTVLVPADAVRRLEMPVEDMAKLLMSLGVLAPQVLKIPLQNHLRKVTNEYESEAASPVERKVV